MRPEQSYNVHSHASSSSILAAMQLTVFVTVWPWPLDLRVNACRATVRECMCTKFGIDSSNRFRFTVWTHRHKVTDPTHDSATASMGNVIQLTEWHHQYSEFTAQNAIKANKLKHKQWYTSKACRDIFKDCSYKWDFSNTFKGLEFQRVNLSSFKDSSGMHAIKGNNCQALQTELWLQPQVKNGLGFVTGLTLTGSGLGLCN